MTMPIESLPNIGPRSSQWLRDAGITTIAELQQLGAVTAWQRVRKQQRGASLNLLWAIAAGLKGKDCRELSETTKRHLRKEAEKLSAEL